MRRFLLALLFGSMVPVILLSQEATFTPVSVPAKAKYIVDRVVIERNGPRVVVEVLTQDSGSTTDFERVTFNVPDGAHPTATTALFLAALDTAVPGETGGALRRANARVLDYLIDHGYLVGVTLVP